MFARLLQLLRWPWIAREQRLVLRVQSAVVVVASVVFALAYAMQRQIRDVMQREQIELVVRSWDGWAWIAWPLAAPVMLLLVRKYPFVRGKFHQNLPRLIWSSAALFIVVINARFAMRVLPPVLQGGPLATSLDWNHYLGTTLVLLPVDILSFCGFMSATFAIDYHFQQRRHRYEALQLQLRATRLESDLAQAELKALRVQLHPHFLFNSFNAVTTLMRQRRNDAAVEVIAQLSALLRLAIDRPGKQELSLDDEMDFIRRYLQIEWIRFGEKLVLNFEIESNTLTAAVPNLLLQPLVENAIKHGISRRSIPGTVSIRARRVDTRLELEIENDGPDIPSPKLPASGPVRAGGIGLSNTRARLEKIFGTDYVLEMVSREDGGMRVRLNLPWRPIARS